MYVECIWTWSVLWQLVHWGRWENVICIQKIHNLRQTKRMTTNKKNESFYTPVLYLERDKCSVINYSPEN